MLFGDATAAMPTPATVAERDSLMGVGSPVPSLDIRNRAGSGQLGADSAIPGLDIDPPDNSRENGKSLPRRNEGSRASEGIGGWISRMVNRNKAQAKGNGSQYRRLEEEDD